MLLIHVLTILWTALISPSSCTAMPFPPTSPANRTYTNPINPGWNSDPSCTFVAERDNTFFCTTSSFLLFPGIPVFASKDLTNWRLLSNALNKPEQLPELDYNGTQSEGIWASTLRYHNGTFYLITAYVSWGGGWAPKILLFTTEDPYVESKWTGPLHVQNPANDIDPDIFWDGDGEAYMSIAAGIWISQLDITTGEAQAPIRVWNGTGDRNPEGPHLYRKDDYYYLMISEGGTETNHSVVISRSVDLGGPYEGYEGNPILTAKNTDDYFQTVGHADLFQDANGNWWATALATRSAPEWEVYPMGREMVLTPARWDEGGWPVLDPVRGEMEGPLPPTNKDIQSEGHWVNDPDIIDFEPGSVLPKHFGFWRLPKADLFSISPPGYPNTLRISPSRVNLTADAAYQPAVDGLAFVARRQAASVFEYSVDISFSPVLAEEEAGITIFLTQFQHIDLGIVKLASNSSSNYSKPILAFRFRVEASGQPGAAIPATVVKSVPEVWVGQRIRLSVAATRDAEYVFSAALVSRPQESIAFGSVNAAIVSGGSGPFTGTLMGAYATSNGGQGTTPAYFSRWRYTPIEQEIDSGVFVPA